MEGTRKRKIQTNIAIDETCKIETRLIMNLWLPLDQEHKMKPLPRPLNDL